MTKPTVIDSVALAESKTVFTRRAVPATKEGPADTDGRVSPGRRGADTAGPLLCAQ